MNFIIITLLLLFSETALPPDPLFLQIYIIINCTTFFIIMLLTFGRSELIITILSIEKLS